MGNGDSEGEELNGSCGSLVGPCPVGSERSQSRDVFTSLTTRWRFSTVGNAFAHWGSEFAAEIAVQSVVGDQGFVIEGRFGQSIAEICARGLRTCRSGLKRAARRNRSLGQAWQRQPRARPPPTMPQARGAVTVGFDFGGQVSLAVWSRRVVRGHSEQSAAEVTRRDDFVKIGLIDQLLRGGLVHDEHGLNGLAGGERL